MNFRQRSIDIINDAQKKLQPQFEYIEDVALFNQNKVLQAFKDNNVGQRHFSQTNGYGYDDIGRDTL